MHIALLPSADLAYESGSIIHAKRLFAYLHDAGHVATMLGSVVPPDIPAERRGYVTANPRLLNHPVVVDRDVPATVLLESLQSSLAFLSGLTSVDLVHAQYASFTSMAAALFGWTTGTPYVVSCFGRDLTIGVREDARLLRFARESLPDAAAIIVPSDDVAAALKTVVTPRPGQLAIIPVPVDETVLAPGGRVFTRGTPLVATVCSCFAPDKGLECTLRAFAEVVKTHECTLIVAGADDHPEQEHAASLTRLVRELGITDRVEFVGYLPRPEVGDLLRQASLLVDSRRLGNFSSVILEAQFVGCPVVASSHAGARLAIRDGWNGLLFPVDDVQRLRDLLAGVLADARLRSTLSDNARRWAEGDGEQYRERHVYRAIEAIYRRAVAGET